MYKSIFLICILIIILAGCNVHISGVYSKSNIDNYDKEQIYHVAKDILQLLRQKNAKHIKSLLPLGSTVEIDSFVKNIPLSNTLNTEIVVGEYLVKTNSPQKFSVKNSDEDHANYRYDFTSIGNDTYIYLLSVESNVPGDRVLISMVFNKENKIWKLIYLNEGAFMYKNLNALQIAKISVQQADSNNLIPAFLNFQIARLLFQPDSNFHYDLENHYADLNNKIVTRLSALYSLPIKVYTVANHPEIYSLSVKGHLGHIFPLVVYKSTLADSVALEQENKELVNQIGSIFPGINQFADSICYTCISGLNRHDFIRKSIN